MVYVQLPFFARWEDVRCKVCKLQWLQEQRELKAAKAKAPASTATIFLLAMRSDCDSVRKQLRKDASAAAAAPAALRTAVTAPKPPPTAPAACAAVPAAVNAAVAAPKPPPTAPAARAAAPAALHTAAAAIKSPPIAPADRAAVPAAARAAVAAPKAPASPPRAVLLDGAFFPPRLGLCDLLHPRCPPSPKIKVEPADQLSGWAPLRDFDELLPPPRLGQTGRHEPCSFQPGCRCPLCRAIVLFGADEDELGGGSGPKRRGGKGVPKKCRKCGKPKKGGQVDTIAWPDKKDPSLDLSALVHRRRN